MVQNRKKYFFYILTLLIIKISIFNYNYIFGNINMQLYIDGSVINYYAPPVHISIDGIALQEADMPPIILNDRTYAPLRHIFESLGAVVDFHDAQRRILIAYNQSLITMYIGQASFNFDGINNYMDVAPLIINDRTMVPIAPLIRAFGYSVSWNQETRTVLISTSIYNNNQNIQNPIAPPSIENQNNNYAEISIDRSQSIHPESNPNTSINSINFNSSQNIFTISATSRIPNIEWTMMPDGRLIVDIIGARLNLNQSNININNSFLSTIRTGQQNINGIDVARIVFDTTFQTIFNISLTQDRMAVVVHFESNNISRIYHNELNNVSEIIIYGEIAQSINTFFLSNPYRLVIDLPNSNIISEPRNINVQNDFINSIRYSQFESNTARIVVDLNSNISYSFHTQNNQTIIRIFEPTFRNFTFDNSNNILNISIPDGLNINQIQEIENYLEFEYSFILPGDFSDFFGHGRYFANSNYVNYIYIDTINGRTQFKFNTTRIFSYIINQNENNIQIRLVNPREKYDFVVVIDPGHGGIDPGAVAHGMRESDWVLEVGLMVVDILNSGSTIRAFSTRHSDVTVPNNNRAIMANEIGNIFVSIHLNAANGIATGTETLYTIHPLEQNSPMNSREISRIFQDNILDEFGFIDRGLRHRPDILVLNSTIIPAALLEIQFMDVLAMSQRLRTQEYKIRSANVIVRSIYEIFEIYSSR